ncbi:unnamed protein product [Protopolystoma xenopodis]|uniref:Uncharacterized protein n=1 Tax=Protopolystoma xenopodis TaxID=117903 RepID=A0A3S5B9U4_9PLAT|nr:unnamed protein product [Protopolystoma xenopodis]
MRGKAYVALTLDLIQQACVCKDTLTAHVLILSAPYCFPLNMFVVKVYRSRMICLQTLQSVCPKDDVCLVVSSAPLMERKAPAKLGPKRSEFLSSCMVMGKI